MKRKPNLNCVALVAALASAAGQAYGAHSVVPVGGTYIYTQNFNTMFMPTAAGSVAAATNWADGTTVPDWYFHYSTNTAPPPAGPPVVGTFAGASFAYNGNDGSAAPALTLNSMGAANNADRAFATPSTTGRCEQSGIVVFENTSASPVAITSLSYNGEVLRTNSTANNKESIHVSYRTAASQAAALTITTENLTAAAAVTKYTIDGDLKETGPTAGNYLTGWTDIKPALWTYSNASAATAVTESIPISATGLTGITVPPGQFLALRFSNPNGGGTDALMGIDDLSVTFTELNASLEAVVSNVTRNDNTTPTDPNDDSVSFNLTVTGAGAVGPGWSISHPSFATSGNYGDTVTISGVSVGLFTEPGHKASIVAADTANPGISTVFSVAAPWCSLTGAIDNVVYSENGTPENAADDTISYRAIASGSFTGADYDITGAVTQNDVPYGSGHGVTGLAPATAALTHTFTDGADPSCTASVVTVLPYAIGTNNLVTTGSVLKSQVAAAAVPWTPDFAARTLSQNNATQADHTILSEVLDLSATPGVQVSAKLTASTSATGSGFEAADYVRVDLIIDGGAPVSILGAADVDGDGRLEGAATNNADTWVELPDAGDLGKAVDYTFSGVVPPGANTVQIRIIGNSNSTGETFLLKDIKVDLAPPGLYLMADGASAGFNNQGTVDPADDIFTVPVRVEGDIPGSTGWEAVGATVHDSPLNGLYAAPNPVTLTLQMPQTPATTRTVQIRDTVDNSKTASLTVTPPARTFAAALATPANIVRNENGPGPEDDTFSFDITVSGTGGGPEFRVMANPATATVASTALTTAPVVHTVTVSPAPALANTVYVRVVDASYTNTGAVIAVAVPAPTASPVTSYVIGQQNFGGVNSDLVSAAVATGWQYYPSLGAFATNAGGAGNNFKSPLIDLQTVGAVNFTARLRTFDYSSGFEAADLFNATLTIDGNTAGLVRTTDAFDTTDPKNGLEATELAIDGGNVGNPTTRTFALSGSVPAGANNVLLDITGITDSNSELIILDQVVLTDAVVGPVDSDGDGMTDDYEVTNGLNPALNDANSDRDGDGQSNIAEFLAGTVANNSASTLGILSIVPGAAGSYNVTIATVPGKKYQLERSPTLTPAGSWVAVGTVTTAAAGTTTTTVNVTIPGVNPAHFLRARVVP